MNKSQNNAEKCKKKIGPKILNSCLISFFVIFIFILAGTFASGIGIAPGDKTYIYSGNDITYDIRIFNDELIDGTYELSVSGELSEYVKLSKKSIIFSQTKQDEVISLTLSIPKDASIAPGDYVLRIKVIDINDDTKGVVAHMSVVSKLTITVPGDKPYIIVDSYVPNFIKGQTNSMSVDITNKGTKSANNCKVVVDIFSLTNSKITTLNSQGINVQGSKTEKVILSWTPEVNNGKYLAKSMVVCDGTSNSIEKIFHVGSPSIDVEIVSSDFTLGEINEFTLLMSSEWGEAISGAYAEVTLTKDDVTIIDAETQHVTVDAYGSKTIPFYLNTKGIAPGQYSLYVLVHYLDKTRGEMFSVKMASNKIEVSKLSGNVIGVDNKDDGEINGENNNGLLILAIVVVIGFNIFFVMKLLKKRKKANK